MLGGSSQLVSSWTPTDLRPWYEVCFLKFLMCWGGGDGNVLDVARMVDATPMMGVLGWGVWVMVTFLDVARMVDPKLMMGVLGWGGGDGNVP